MKVIKKNNKPIIEIIAPASPVSKKELLQSYQFVKSLGFQPYFNGSIQSSSCFFAQDHQDCLTHLKKALMNKNSKIIWALRGGYGSQRLLPDLFKLNNLFKNRSIQKKIFIGHSDTTVIHDWIHHFLSWPSLHFPVLTQTPTLSPSSIKKMQDFLNQSHSYCVFKNLQVLNPNNFKKNNFSSKITGGNMTIIQGLLGTPWNFSRKNKFLFLEDNANEKPYRIHRTLWQMKESGLFKGIQALIFGKFMIQNQNIINNVLKPFSKQVSFPVITNLNCGHTKTNFPLPLNSTTKITISGKKAQIKIPLNI